MEEGGGAHTRISQPAAGADGRLRCADAASFAALLGDAPHGLSTSPSHPVFGGGGGRFATVLDGVLSPAACQAIIADTERRGYVAALLNMGGGVEALRPDVRSNTRCIVDSPEFADALFARVRHALPEEFFGARIVGLNERLRFLRYDPGERFRVHRDGSFERTSGARECTLVTLLLYLNDGYTGCFTTFYKDRGIEHLVPDEGLAVEPRPGRVLMHEHELLHAANALESGRKYVLRTDVLYKFQ
jgi:hypothetical protein